MTKFQAGWKVRKCNSKSNDNHLDGEKGVIVAVEKDGRWCVNWEDVMGRRVSEDILECDHQWEQVRGGPGPKCSQCGLIDTTIIAPDMPIAEESKFRVGQKVRANTDDGFNGEHGIVVSVENSINNPFSVMLEGYPSTRCFQESELECDHRWVKSERNRYEILCHQCGERTLVNGQLALDEIVGIKGKYLEDEIEEAKDGNVIIVNKAGDWLDYNFPIERDKMENPKTKLEKQACKDAIERVTNERLDEKRKQYEIEVADFVVLERAARKNRESADEKKKLLGLTDAQIEQLL